MSTGMRRSNLIATGEGYPVTVANEGVSGAASSNGGAIIPFVLDKLPRAQFVMINYGHNDYRDGVSTGLGFIQATRDTTIPSRITFSE